MTMLPRLAAGVLAALAPVALLQGHASAQLNPPQTIIGSIADEDGPVPAGLTVEAYVDEKLCGTGETELVGEGEPKTTVYAVDVFAATQRPGCGSDGVEVRVKIGDRFAPQTVRWRAGLAQMDVTFGDIEPAPIPTATPTATRTATPSEPESEETPEPGETPQPGETPSEPGDEEEATPTEESEGTIPAGSPGAGSPIPLRGGVTSSTSGPGGGESDDGGFPLWGIVLIGLVLIGGAGGGVGLLMARSRRSDDDDMLLAPPRE